MFEIISALIPFLLLGLAAAGLFSRLWCRFIYGYSAYIINLGCHCR